ncbi:ADP-ribosylation factor family [Thraustotheca clavata]|uniref:ADP-ribosylation factor family n=1 Tax=Thraustotheca clavata TaxID=74557 RepID=A0A1W0A6F3_9STRA|nr:ADP-ribosylation factor family [Thraustotheca clavata]
MGSTLSRKIVRFWTRNHRRVLLVGLDAAGKTTILYHLRLHKALPTLPTIGFNSEAVALNGLTLDLFDVGGQDSLRPYWRHHFTGTQGIVFVVDSSDAERMELAKAELHGVLHDDQLVDACLLVILNKRDLVDGSVEQVVQELDFNALCQEQKRPFHIQPTVATTGDGLKEGFAWLCATMEPL